MPDNTSSTVTFKIQSYSAAFYSYLLLQNFKHWNLLKINPVSKVASDDRSFLKLSDLLISSKRKSRQGLVTCFLEPVLSSRSYVPYRWPYSSFQYLVQVHIAIHGTIEPHHWMTTPVDNTPCHYIFLRAFSCIQLLHVGVHYRSFSQCEG